MSKSVEATATFVIANQSETHMHAYDFMLIWHHSVQNIDMHVYFNSEREILKSMKVLVVLIELLN